ncbi:MAG: EAL domain-containing protein [Magnetococcales bacterium]|nr:EAL domain-containing protein [Magnetococcales bacterium]
MAHQNQGSIGTKVGMGFMLVVALFLFVIWRHQIVLERSQEEYRYLWDQVQARKDAALDIRRYVLEARQAEAEFFLIQDWFAVSQVQAKVEQVEFVAGSLDRGIGLGGEETERVRGLMANYLKQFLAIANAWREKGLDHDSGLQGRFRQAVHKMESMSDLLAHRLPLIGVQLEKDILSLRRREKDYLLRGDQKYVRKVKSEIQALDRFINNAPLESEEVAQFQQLMIDYQEGFLALVAQNDQIIAHTKEMRLSVEQIEPLLREIVSNADQAMNQTMAELSQRSEKHRESMLWLTIISSLLGFLITLMVVLWSSAQHRKLLRSSSRIQAIMDNAVDGIVTIDEKGIIESVNPALENTFGYPTGELVGLNVSVLMPSPFREEHDGYLKHHLKTGERKIIGSIREVMGVCRDGGQFPLDLSVSSYQVGGKTYFTGILHDITERKQAKDALEKAYDELEMRVRERTGELENTNLKLQHEIDERIRAEEGLKLAAKVFENASEAILITDHRGIIIDVNQAFTNITGFEREEALGENPRIGKSGRHDADFYDQMWTEITNSGKWSGEIWDRRKNGEVYPKWLTINAVHTPDEVITHYVGIFTDISHIKATEQRLEQLAFYDPLTSLPNRMLFRDRLLHEFEAAKRYHKRVGVFFIDLDRFKNVNDTLGHAAGDMLLEVVARRLTECVRSSDTVARLGGDEFTVILADLDGPQEAAPIARNIIKSLMEPVPLDEHKAHIGASIGIAIFPDDGGDFDTITKFADVAMYHAKASGRGNFKFFEGQMNANSIKRAELEKNLRLGLDADEFLLHYQPKLSLSTGKIVGMESLVRWQRADGKMISPADFIPLAEETGLIIPMGEKILRSACIFNKRCMEETGVPLRVAVNLSARQFQQKNLHDLVEKTLQETGLEPKWLELEVTESMMMLDEKQAIATLNRLREIGISIAMDDFGTGYSSLSYLKRFPIQSLKVDQSFVRDITTDPDDAAIVQAIVSMAKSLRLHVVAEGVETEDQAVFLDNITCDELQGYFFSRPLPEADFLKFIQTPI